MISRVFDGFTRQSGESVPRRASLRVLGGSALAAVVTPAAIAAAKGGKKDKKRCRRQRAACRATIIAACRATIIASCENDPPCEESLLPCCEPLARCNGAATVECLFSAP